MKKIDFRVKENSICKFFEDYSKHEKVIINNHFNDQGVSVYHLLQDSIIMNLNSFNVGELVEISLSDKSVNSNKELINTYIYKVTEYDDVSCELN